MFTILVAFNTNSNDMCITTNNNDNNYTACTQAALQPRERPAPGGAPAGRAAPRC